DDRLRAGGLARQAAADYMAGLEVDWQKVFGDARPVRVALPTYPFERERHWHDMTDDAGPAGRAARLGRRLPRRTPVFGSRLAGTAWSFVVDHGVAGAPVVPGAAWLDLAAAATREIQQGAACELADISFDRLLPRPPGVERTLEFVVLPGTAGSEFQVL